MSRTTIGRGLLATVALAIVALTYWRLYYGVDFTDEAWYVAVPYRFVLGGKPYVDELSVPQTTAAVLLYPFLWLYHAVAGRTGLVLFVRHLHFLVALAVGAAVGFGLRRVAGSALALIGGLAAFVFVPFNIPSISYDSLGSGFFTAGTVLGYLALSRARVRPLAGVCLGLAAFSYPPLVVAVVATCALQLWLQREHWRSRLVPLVGPALGIPVLGFAVIAAVAGPHRIVSDYRRSSHYLGQAGGLTKLHGIAAHLKETLPLWYLLAAALILIAWSWRRWPRLAALTVVVLPLTTLPPALSSYASSLNFVAHVGFLALALLIGIRARPGAVQLFTAVWLPALCGGVITSYSSANGGVNFGVGFFPAVVVTLVFAAWAVRDLTGLETRVDLVPALLITGLLVAFSTLGVYRDGTLSTLGTRLTNGPYAGLETSSDKQHFLDTLATDLTGVNGRCTIAFFQDFPAGYLLTAARPDTSAVWTATVSGRLTFPYHRDLVDYWQQQGLPDVVVEMLRIPFALPGGARIEHYAAADPLLEALRTHTYRVSARRLDYIVWRRGASC